ncbi:hypothetical protein AB5I41_06880 [Sphingomonas sp. MMS24-JH45]
MRDGGGLTQIEGAARRRGGGRAGKRRRRPPRRPVAHQHVDRHPHRRALVRRRGCRFRAGALHAQLLLSSAIDDGVTGGGVRASLGSAEAQLRAVVLIHMPDVSTGAQVLGAGWLSRAGIGGSYRLSPDWTVQADAGFNRYGLASGGAASDTTTLAGGIDWLVRRSRPGVTLGYRFEADVLGRRRSSGRTGRRRSRSPRARTTRCRASPAAARDRAGDRATGLHHRPLRRRRPDRGARLRRADRRRLADRRRRRRLLDFARGLLGHAALRAQIVRDLGAGGERPLPLDPARAHRGGIRRAVRDRRRARPRVGRHPPASSCWSPIRCGCR